MKKPIPSYKQNPGKALVRGRRRRMRGERRQRRHREKKVREANNKQIFSGEGEVKGEAGLQGW